MNAMNSKSTVKVLFVENVIEINKTFAKMSENPFSEEYKMLQQIRKDYPSFTIRIRQIKKNSNKNSYKGLTYEYMRDYIILHTNPENESEAVAEFDELLMISRCQKQSLRYPTIKKWFLKKYPEVANFAA